MSKRITIAAAVAAAVLAIPAFIALNVSADFRQQKCERAVFATMGVQVPSIVQAELARARCR